MGNRVNIESKAFENASARDFHQHLNKLKNSTDTDAKRKTNQVTKTTKILKSQENLFMFELQARKAQRLNGELTPKPYESPLSVKSSSSKNSIGFSSKIK